MKKKSAEKASLLSVFSRLSLKTTALILSISLLTISILIMGAINYNDHKIHSYAETEAKISQIVLDWTVVARSYIKEYDRLMEREEEMEYKKLSAVALDVRDMLDIVYRTNDENPSPEDMELVYDKISNIDLGLSGYVALVDSHGNYIVSKDRLVDGMNTWNATDEIGNYISQYTINNTINLHGNETLSYKYNWTDYVYNTTGSKISASCYYEPLDLIILATTYYTDYKSYNLIDELKDEVKVLMEKQDIGELGYIWVLDTSGYYIVSKDGIRDGEYIYDTKNSDGTYPIRELIDMALELGNQTHYIHYYSWRNKGETEDLKKVAAVTYLPEWDWVIGASAYEVDFLRTTKRTFVNTLLISVTFIIAASLIIYFFIFFHIIKPLNELEYNALLVKSGHLNLKFSKKRYNIAREFQNLISTFQMMTKSLRLKINALERSKNNSTQLTNELKEKVIKLQRTESSLKLQQAELTKAKSAIEEFNSALEDKVSERTKDLEKANKKISKLLETKTQFVNQVAHDLRTPLTPIKVLLPLIRNKIKDDVPKDILEKIDILIDNSKYLADLVHDTLNIARLDAGSVKFDLRENSLSDVIKQVISNNMIIFKQSKIKVVNKLAGKRIPILIFDFTRIVEVVSNLVSNSMKFFDKKQKIITFDVEVTKSNVTLIVSDNGSGIEPDMANKIFEEFYKSDESRHENSSGLGLSICSRIMDAHTGEIWAESDGPGKGLRVYVQLRRDK